MTKKLRELMNSIMASEANEESEFLSALMLLLRDSFTKLSKMNKQNAFIESYAMGKMFWPCYRPDKCCFVGRTANAT